MRVFRMQVSLTQVCRLQVFRPVLVMVSLMELPLMVKVKMCSRMWLVRKC
jgi:hypothetical protein